MKLSNAERLVVALCLARDWQGDMATLEGSAAAFDALKLGVYSPHLKANGFDGPKGLASDDTAEYRLTTPAVEVLFRLLPGAPTPFQLGRAKVDLLRRLRAALPKPRPEKPEKPENKKKEPKK